MIILDICVSDIPKHAIRKSEKNGKSYLSLVVDERKNPDNYGNTHTLYVNQSKEERQAKEDKTYVGSGREFVFNQQSKTTKNEEYSDDLPF